MNNIIRKTNGGSALPSTSFSGLVDQLFETNLNRFFDDTVWGFNNRMPNHVPANIRETDSSYELDLFAPGCKKEDFKVDISGQLLTVSFDHKEENKEEDKKTGYIRQEFRRQSFSRSFNIDESVDANKISARYEDGILHMTLPKKESAQKITRTISIG